MREIRIGWVGNQATACYVDRRGNAEGILGYISIEKREKDYMVNVADARGNPGKPYRTPALNSRALAMLAGENLLINMIKAA